MWLVRLSIFRPIFISMVTLFLIVLGLVSYWRLGVDQFPKIDPPIIIITIEYPGAGPAEVESLVSKPVEKQINQIAGIERLISTSRDSFAQIVVEFKLEVNAMDALTDVRDKVSRAREDLPDEAMEPLIERMDFADRPIVRIALMTRQPKIADRRSEKLQNDGYLRYLADEVFTPQLQTVAGVGRVDVFGGLEREVLVQLNLQKLMMLNLTPAQVREAVLKANLNVPAGEINEQPTGRSIRLVGEFSSPRAIENTVIKTLAGGTVLRIRDVGEVIDSYKDRSSIARVDGKQVVMLEVRKQSDANTVKVADNIQKRIDEINKTVDKSMYLEAIYDGARAIRNTLNDVVETLVIAAILAIIVVYFFLGSLQSTVVTGLALPMTIIGCFLAIYLYDYTLNIMTLLGLTLSVGLILDDAIVVRENIWTKIEAGYAPKEAALEGTRQVFVAVLATSLTILAVFIPVTFIPGIVGRFFAAFAVTVCFAVIFSTFDALTMAPMLSAHWISKKGADGYHKTPNFFLRYMEMQGGRVSEFYSRILDKALTHPIKVLVIALGIFVSSLFLGKFVGFTFLPQDESGEIEIALEAPPGTTVETMDEIVQTFEKYLKGQPEIVQQSTRIGNDFGDENIALILMRLVPQGDRDVTTGGMIARLQTDLKSITQRYRLSMGIRPPGGGGGRGKPVSLVIQGPDNQKLFDIANQVIAEGSEKLPDLVNVDSNLKAGRSELQFVIDHVRLAEFGLTTSQVGDSVRGLFEGDLAGKYRELGSEFDIRVRARPEDRVDLGALRSMTIPNQRNEAIPITAVTDMVSSSSPTKIVRINQMRAALIEADLAPGAPLARAIRELSGYVATILPAGYRQEFQGQAKSLGELALGAMIALGLGALFIYMIMASLYESLIIPFSILLTLPLAIVGAIIALLGFQKNLDIYGVIGIILLMGLVTKNAILLIDYVEQLRGEGMDKISALREGGRRRLRPIMMTTIAMVAGMLPVAFGYGEVNKIRAGMGIAAIGGMLSSTFLSLIVVPCAYSMLLYIFKIDRTKMPSDEELEAMPSLKPTPVSTQI